jgi:hypothetical protein
MAWNNPNELVVGGTGQVYVAPVGTALPTDPVAALAAAYNGLGLTDEDGVSVTMDPDITEFRAWQSRVPVRRALTGQTVTFAFKLEQWNENTVPLAFGGGVVTALGGGKYRYTLPSGQDALDERTLVCDVIDGATTWRFVAPRGNVAESVSADFRRTELGILPITFRATAPSTDPEGPPAYFLTNSAAFATGS